jgi:hypothetical protein
MSARCVAWVLENTTAKNTDHLVLIYLADYANPDTDNAWPSVQNLADKANIGKSTCRESLRRLEAQGRISTVGETPRGTTIYKVLMTASAAAGRQNLAPARSQQGGRQISAGGAPESGPESKTEPKTEPTNNPPKPPQGGESDCDRVKFSGKPIQQDHLELTQAVLTAFNEQTGKQLALFTGTGELSESAKRIYSRIRAYPDITLAKFEDIIARTLASEWWGSDQPTVGVVFGPKVFEDNITRPGLSTAKPRDELKARNERRKAAGRRVLADRERQLA